jgi:hypothetical protein
MSNKRIEQDFLLHVLRNPQGHSAGLVRRVRLRAADYIEEQEKELKAVREEIDFQNECNDELQTLVATLTEALKYLSDDGWFNEESTSWKQERDSRIKFAASFLPPKEDKS